MFQIQRRGLESYGMKTSAMKDVMLRVDNKQEVAFYIIKWLRLLDTRSRGEAFPIERRDHPETHL